MCVCVCVCVCVCACACVRASVRASVRVQTNVEISKEGDWEALLRAEEDWIKATCDEILQACVCVCSRKHECGCVN